MTQLIKTANTYWQHFLCHSQYETRRRRLFLLVLCVCQMATFLITWPLWQNRDFPPMLPLLPLYSLDMGFWLLLSILVIPFFPRLGLASHSLILFYALITDQTRLEPQIFSTLLLMWATLPSHSLRMIARAHLIALWFYGGFQKLTSANFFANAAPWVLRHFFPEAPLNLANAFGISAKLVVIATEMGLAILAFRRSSRIIASYLAFMVHMGILIALSPWVVNWNASVWPWNFALTLSGFFFFYSWKDSFFSGLKQCRQFVRVSVLLILITPLGYHFGLINAHLAYVLYSGNKPQASIHSPSNQTDQIMSTSWRYFKVPFPPSIKLYKSYFYQVCHENDRLIIIDPRLMANLKGQKRQEYPCRTTLDRTL